MRLDTQDVRNIGYFESMTGARVVDSLSDETTVSFLVKKGDLGKAVGKGGTTINKIRKALGKHVFVFEDSEDDKAFIRNLYKPAAVREIDIEEDKITVQIPRAERMQITSRRASIINSFIQRKLDIKKIVISSR